MGMVQRHRKRPTHQSVAAQRAVKARQPAHFEDLPYPFTLFPQQPARGIKELRLAAGVGAVSELVLEALKTHGVALSVRQKARHKKAG